MIVMSGFALNCSGGSECTDAGQVNCVQPDVPATAPWTAVSARFRFRVFSPNQQRADGGPPPLEADVIFDRTLRTLRGPYVRATDGNNVYSSGQLNVFHTLTDAEMAELLGLLEALRVDRRACNGFDGIVKTIEIGTTTFTIGATSCSVPAQGHVFNGQQLQSFIDRFAQ